MHEGGYPGECYLGEDGGICFEGGGGCSGDGGDAAPSAEGVERVLSFEAASSNNVKAGVGGGVDFSEGPAGGITDGLLWFFLVGGGVFRGV